MLVHNDKEIILTFTLLFGTSVSAMRFRRPGSILRQWREDMLIAISDSSLFNNEFMNGSAPVVEQLNSAQKISRPEENLPLSNRLKSKLVLLSKIRFSCAAVTILRICKCRYSRCDRVLLHEIENAKLNI